MMRMLTAGFVVLGVGAWLSGDIAVAGDLFEADNGSGTIYEFTPGGGKSAFATGLYGPWGLAFDKSGNLYEADQGSGNVYEFTSGGSKSIFVTGLNYPRSLAFDGSGNLFAGDRVGGDIYEFAPSMSAFATGLSPADLAFTPVPEAAPLSSWASVP